MKTAVPIILAPLAAALPGMTPRQAAQSVHDAFVAAGKDFFGVATDQGVLGQGSTRAVVTSNFGQVTGENSMKWGSLEATRGSYNWAPADYLADFAEENGLKLRGHTLVWHSQLPSWVQAITDAEELRGVIREHIATVVGRYAGKAAHWDVLNEILNEDGTLRDSVFSRLLGEEFVEIAFKAAREADPDAKLYINDYNLDQANYAKVTGMVSLVEKWVNQGIPIDGIGTQSHLGAGGGAGVQAALEKLATAPVEQIAITELDIASAPAADYTAVVQGCLNVEKCVSITVWGVSDSGENPLLFNDSFQPKEAYNAIIGLLS